MEETNRFQSKSEKYANAFIKDERVKERECIDCKKFLKPNKEGQYFTRCYDCAIIHKNSYKYKCSICFKQMEKDFPNCFECGEMKRKSYKFNCKICDKKMEKNFPTCFPCRTANDK